MPGLSCLSHSESLVSLFRHTIAVYLVQTSFLGMHKTGVSFSVALEAVKAGKIIQRHGWNGKGLTVKAQYPDEHSKMTLPYLYIEYPSDSPNTPGARCPWLASQTDILADDWIIL